MEARFTLEWALCSLSVPRGKGRRRLAVASTLVDVRGGGPWEERGMWCTVGGGHCA